MKFSQFAYALVGMATMVMAQGGGYQPPPPPVGGGGGGRGGGGGGGRPGGGGGGRGPGYGPSATLVPTGASPVVAPTPATTAAALPPYDMNNDQGPPPEGSMTTLLYYDCTDSTGGAGGATVTDVLTSTTCDQCHNVYTTVYTVTWENVCPTGITSPVYTITETCTGNPASFTPTTLPEDFTVAEKICTACQNPESTVTVTEPCTTTAPGPPPPYTTAPQPNNKPFAGTTYNYPPAQTSGPQQVIVNGASGSNVKFTTVAVGLVGPVFAGMFML